MGRDVAIKTSAERFSERFEREVRAVATLNHPNICTIYDVGPNYFVMELVEGETFGTGAGNSSGRVFSPDGRWIAYISDESGRREIYVQGANLTSKNTGK